MKFPKFLVCLTVILSSRVSAAEEAPVGMVKIAGGTFTMGSNLPGSRKDEQPLMPVTLDSFWMDATPVTNAEFRKFTEATGYKTIAERPINWEEMKKQLPPNTPKPADEMLVPGGMVFTPRPGAVRMGAQEDWWAWVHGADWQHTQGPDSDLKGRDNHPVVMVAWDDAAAYAKWAGKRLPTEAEWEYAARGGLEGKRFAWGDELQKDGKFMANTWTGTFPEKDSGADGFAGIAPVKSFPANGYGLFDMGGNVWNWCSDWYRVDTLARLKLAGKPAVNPTGPATSYSPGHPLQPERIIKGGSFMCNVSYSEGYRPSARRGSPTDSGMSHIGFRCAKSVAKE
ncbi:MAG: formylglycine-generating enzyme family protein [Verrucomicrobiota bacterium]